MNNELPANNGVTFIKSAVTRGKRHFCHSCFYNTEDKNERIKKYPKPAGTKCLIGSAGYYIYYGIDRGAR